MTKSKARKLAEAIATDLLSAFGEKEGTRLEIKRLSPDGSHEDSLGGHCKASIIGVIEKHLNGITK